jgi:hypothetical protein
VTRPGWVVATDDPLSREIECLTTQIDWLGTCLTLLLDPSAKYFYVVVLLGSRFTLWCPLVDRIRSLGRFRAQWGPWIAFSFLASFLLLAMSLSYQFLSGVCRRRSSHS